MPQHTLHNFAARCPEGHRPAQSHSLAELRSPVVRFYCKLCEKGWTPKKDELSRARDFAEASEDWSTYTPPTAA